MGWLNKIFKGSSSHNISEGQYHGRYGEDAFWTEPSSHLVIANLQFPLLVVFLFFYGQLDLIRWWWCYLIWSNFWLLCLCQVQHLDTFCPCPELIVVLFHPSTCKWNDSHFAEISTSCTAPNFDSDLIQFIVCGYIKSYPQAESRMLTFQVKMRCTKVAFQLLEAVMISWTLPFSFTELLSLSNWSFFWFSFELIAALLRCWCVLPIRAMKIVQHAVLSTTCLSIVYCHWLLF